MMKRIKSIRWSLAVVAMVLFPFVVANADGPQPSVGLYWFSSVDPTAGAGVCAPLNQLLIRTDTIALYYKSGSTCTGWTAIAGGGAGDLTGTLTAGTIPVAVSVHGVGDSQVTQTTSLVTVNGRRLSSLDTTQNQANATANYSVNFDNTGSTVDTTSALQIGWALHLKSATENGGAETHQCTASGIKIEQSSATCTIGASLDVPSFIEMNSNQIHDLLDPTGPQDADTQNARSAAITSAVNAAVNGTNGNLVSFNGAHTTTNYAGTTCGSAAITALAATGAATCTGAAPVLQSATLPILGSGGDGAVTFDGVTTPVCGATLSGSTYTMMRDCMATNITINAGVTVFTANWLPLATGTLNFAGAGATIENDGNAGGKNGSCSGSCSAVTSANRYPVTIAGGTAGVGGGNSASVPYGYYTVNGSNPAGGGTGAAGTGGAALSGQGGGGGGCSGAAGSGAAGGSTARNATGLAGDFTQLTMNGRGTQPGGGTIVWTFGAGGGSGSTCAAASGTGGAGGGLLVVLAHDITGGANCNIHARGGAGGAGTVGGTTGGGGGGGGGGLVVVGSMTRSCSNIDANGGTGGAGNGATNKGGDGGSGHVLTMTLGS